MERRQGICPGARSSRINRAGANPIGANPVITINAANVVVDGFTLKNPVTTGAAIGIPSRRPAMML